MSARKHYIKVPTDYIQELRKNGQRKKSRCFFEYIIDINDGEHNSVRFYAQSWELSIGAVHKYIKEFKEEIDKFESFLELKNAKQNSSVKNEREHFVNKMNTDKAQNIGVCKTQRERTVNKDYNITTTIQMPSYSSTDGEFNIYYSELKMFAGNYVGKKEEVYKSYKRVKKFMNIKILLIAYKKYFNENKNNKTTGLKKFIDDDTYLHYLPTQRIKVKSERGTFTGEYKDEVFISDDGVRFSFPIGSFIKRLERNEIEFVFEEVA